MPIPTRITLPPSGRPVGGLLSAARPIGGDWTRGVMFTSGQCLIPAVYGECAGDDATGKALDNLSNEQAFHPFSIVQAVQCSTLGRTEVDVFARQALDVTREFGAASELQSGAASGNPSLKDATTTLTAATDPVTALACIDQRANTDLGGRLAFIHVPPLVATHLLSASAIWKDGIRWRTASGNTLVISPAYDGRGPGETTAPSAGEPAFIYATGEVYAEFTGMETLQSVERSQNSAQAWAEDAALVAFDPCFLVAIDSGINAC